MGHTEQPHTNPARRLGLGQIAVEPADPETGGPEQVQHLYRLSDPALSELNLDELLDELLLRISDALDVDTAAILLRDEDTQQLVARAAKGIEEEVEHGVRIPIGAGFAGRIAAERVAIFVADVDHADILNPILREKGVRSLLGVPLIVEGELIGVLHVGSLTPRDFDEKDAAVLQIAAARAGPAIERARLFSALEREHRVAMLLQRSLLPKGLSRMWGVPVSARYLPARFEVGGDWYDVIELPRGRLGVVIGDVVGHGIRAAALMGQLRTALHAYAIEGHGPGRTLELVDSFTRNLGETAMATAAYGVFDTDGHSICLATAGHLPPLVIAGARSRVIDVPATTPLGVSSYGRYPETEISLTPGEIFALYTDGLVERHGDELADGIERLVDLVRDAPSPDAACLLAVGGMVPDEGPSDDVAIVACQDSVVTAELHLRLEANPGVLAQVRHELRRWLRDKGASDDAMAEITIAASEACANVVEHAYSPAPAEFDVHAEASAGEVTVTIRDRGLWRKPRGEHRGRGLTIINTAMDHVEVNATSTGTEILMRRRLGAP
ncbi:MAG: SpoIIE family protein phosphatase [Actinomycetota bacterium]|nr:SpoIIE family protein phosphatase [Actinomycetota bacterium]